MTSILPTCAEGETRTPTPQRALRPERSASADSATSARYASIIGHSCAHCQGERTRGSTKIGGRAPSAYHRRLVGIRPLPPCRPGTASRTIVSQPSAPPPLPKLQRKQYVCPMRVCVDPALQWRCRVQHTPCKG